MRRNTKLQKICGTEEISLNQVLYRLSKPSDHDADKCSLIMCCGNAKFCIWHTLTRIILTVCKGKGPGNGFPGPRTHHSHLEEVNISLRNRPVKALGSATLFCVS